MKPMFHYCFTFTSENFPITNYNLNNGHQRSALWSFREKSNFLGNDLSIIRNYSGRSETSSSERRAEDDEIKNFLYGAKIWQTVLKLLCFSVFIVTERLSNVIRTLQIWSALGVRHAILKTLSPLKKAIFSWGASQKYS